MMSSIFIFFNFTYIIKTRDENYSIDYYISLYSIKNKALLNNQMLSTHQIKDNIS